MEIKHVSIASLKVPTSDGLFEGRFTSLDIDADGDRFLATAFEHQNGKTVPAVYSHTYADPAATIGKVVLSTNTETVVANGGVIGRGRLDVQGPSPNPMALVVWERASLPASDKHAMREFSIGFTWDPADTFKGPDGERVIAKADIIEVSFVVAGAQPDTRIFCMGDACKCGGTCQPPVAKVGTLAELREQMLAQHGDDDVIREALGMPTRASVAASKAAARMARARADLAMRSLAIGMRPAERILVDSKFRPVVQEYEDERAAEARAEDLRRIERRDQERAAEAAERERMAALNIDDGTFRYELGRKA